MLMRERISQLLLLLLRTAAYLEEELVPADSISLLKRNANR